MIIYWNIAIQRLQWDMAANQTEIEFRDIMNETQFYNSETYCLTMWRTQIIL